jgi:hypothetical protein
VIIEPDETFDSRSDAEEFAEYLAQGVTWPYQAALTADVDHEVIEIEATDGLADHMHDLAVDRQIEDEGGVTMW